SRKPGVTSPGTGYATIKCPAASPSWWPALPQAIRRPTTALSFCVLETSSRDLRVCAKTNVGQKAQFKQNAPHPDPLPSDGRGNSQTRLSQLPKRLDTPTDGGRFSLSHPTPAAPEAPPRRVGEGRGEGECFHIFPQRTTILKFSTNA